VSCVVTKHSEVIEFTLHCETKTLYLQTRTAHGKIKIFPVDLTPVFTGCDGEDLFPLVDTRLADPVVSEPNDGRVRVTFNVVNVATGDVLGTEFFYLPYNGIIDDAPADGQIYGRKDNSWVVISPVGDSTINPPVASYDNIK